MADFPGWTSAYKGPELKVGAEALVRHSAWPQLVSSGGQGVKSHGSYCM